MSRGLRISLFLAVIGAATTAHAQAVDRRYADEPTGGLSLPATPLAGEHDARAVTVNPGGLALLRGPELALALELQDEAVATSGGPGFGILLGTSAGGTVAPRLGFGLGLEWLRPARAQLSPDPGEPFRLTLASAVGLGPRAGLGVAWHHFIAEGALSGRDTFDVGLSTRWGSHLAIGAALRDLATQPIAGVPVQRRYELETVVRPLATDRLELAVGGRLGETRRDLDGWARLVARVGRGVFVVGNVESRELFALEDSPSGLRETTGRELRATVGIDLSFGALGVGALATGVRDDAGGRHALGTTLIVRASSLGPPSVFGREDRIERVELSGSIGARGLTAHVVRLRAIARDASARALVVQFDGLDAGWATLQELRDELLAVRRAGKKVFAYMVSGTGRDYYVASAADKIYLDPAGGLRIVGLAATTLYFRGAFDQVGVSPQFEKIAEYKSAPEQFTETAASEAAARMYGELYDSLWEQWVAAVAEGRKLSPGEVQALVDGGPYTAGDLAKDTRLVDAVAPPDKISQLVFAELGRAYRVGRPPVERPERWQRPTVAVIYVEGDITDGKSRTIPILGRSLAGGETLVAAITAARNDPRVGAIILRIDSPGGSAVASELVSREVFATRGVKPILCSLGNLAASGGYFIAAGCDVIFSEPATITGSIGIFYGKFDLSGLAQRAGVTFQTYTRGQRADVESLFRPYTEEERGILLDKLRYMYGRFIGAVADGRKLTTEQVDAAGRGQVYTGAHAQTRKLVDRFGGLGDALDEAKRRMGLGPDALVQLVELPRPPSSLFGVLGNLIGAREPAGASVLELPVVRQLLRGVPASVIASPDVPQARLPIEIQFE
jgi:protease IV